MSNFKFFVGKISQEDNESRINENAREDILNHERYLRDHYEQMRRLDDIIEENKIFSQQRNSLTIKPKFSVRVKMFFQKINLLFFTEKHQDFYDKFFLIFVNGTLLLMIVYGIILSLLK